MFKKSLRSLIFQHCDAKQSTFIYKAIFVKKLEKSVLSENVRLEKHKKGQYTS